MKTPLPLIILGVVAILGLLFFFLRGTQGTGNSAQATTIRPAEYVSQFSEAPHFLLDVRTPEEFQAGHIPGAINISVQTLASRLSEVPTDQPVIVYCRSGNRSASATQILANAGYTPVYDMGGILAWQAQGYPVQ